MQSEEDVEEVFELELDWTPVNKDSGEAEPVPLKLTKEAQRERVSKKRNESVSCDNFFPQFLSSVLPLRPVTC